MIVTRCPHCGKRFQARPDLIGRPCRCQFCGDEFPIRPEGEEAAAPEEEAITAAPPGPGAPQAVASVRPCVRHPDVTAPHRCARCATPICDTCAFTGPDGGFVCPDCMTVRKQGVASGDPHRTFHVPPVGLRCARHATVEAVRWCKLCRAAICPTCDFTFPGDVHLCPECATKPQTGLSSKRRKLLFWSFALAGWSTLATAAVLVYSAAASAAGPTSKHEEDLVGMIFGLLTFWPSLIGLATGVADFDRRLTNLAVIWVAVAWNGVVLAGLLTLIVIGLLMGGA
jgi:hypothetical protein